MSKNLQKSADFLGFELEFSVISLSFEFFPTWVFLRMSKQKAWITGFEIKTMGPSSFCLFVLDVEGGIAIRNI